MIIGKAGQVLYVDKKGNLEWRDYKESIKEKIIKRNLAIWNKGIEEFMKDK